jgi:hypothetical protein
VMLSGVNYLRQATVAITDAQIKSRAVVELVPATETLAYAGFPTLLPVPVSAFGFINNAGGVYEDVAAADASSIVLAWGADWSLTASVAWDRNESTPLSMFGVLDANPQTHKSLTFNTGFIWDQAFTEGSFQDNGLYVKVANDVDLTAGHASNFIRVAVAYYLLNTVTGQFVPE